MKDKQNFNYRDCLTNEQLLKRFSSQFDLVRYAIQLAGEHVERGQESSYIDEENIAVEVLSEIAEGKDQYTDILRQEEEEEEILEENAIRLTRIV